MKNCLSCNILKEITEFYKNHKKCKKCVSKITALKYHNSKPPLENIRLCQVCEKPFKPNHRGHHLCSESCMYKRYNNKRFKNSKKRRLIGVYEYRKVKKNSCEFCGFVAVHPCQLDVDHIDGNHSNNNLDNLQTLCANCHRLKTFLNREGPYKKMKN